MKPFIKLVIVVIILATIVTGIWLSFVTKATYDNYNKQAEVKEEIEGKTLEINKQIEENNRIRDEIMNEQ